MYATLFRPSIAVTLLTSTFSTLAPVKVAGYSAIDPEQFSYEQAGEILKTLGACEQLQKTYKVVRPIMANILASSMVQGMAKGTLTVEEWELKYMKADALYIYRLGSELTKRVENEADEDKALMGELAEMFLGYGKHIERLKKYGLTPSHQLMSPECDSHIDYLTKRSGRNEFYIAILTDMIPYVVFANYLLNSMEQRVKNPWLFYAVKYGDLDNRYAKERLGKTIIEVNKIFQNNEISQEKSEEIFKIGFSFEEWFIRHAFSEGHLIRG